LKEAKAKILAVLTLILKGDKVAAEYLFISLVSRVHSRETGLMIGNIATNITNLTK
jgi:hypothetical protein